MPNNELLKAKIDDSGMTLIAISEKSGIDRATIYNRLNNRGEWKASEIVAIAETLKLSKADREKIFLS